jgi:hypothetical protein
LGLSLLKSAVDEWAIEDLETLSDDELADQLVDLDTVIDQLELQRSRRLDRFNRRKSFAGDGYSSATAFLIHRCKMAPGRAARLVAQAKSLSEMPETVRVWSDERLSADQVRHLIVAHDTNPALFSEQEPGLVEAVESLGVQDTGRAVTYWRQAVNDAAFEKDAAELHDMRRVHLSKSFEGMGRLDGWLDPLSFEIVRAALDGATAPPAEGDQRTPAQRRADALVDVARLALDEGRLPEKGGEKPHLLVIVSLDQLTGHGPSQRHGETVDGTVLSRSDLDYLSCDCSISRLVMGPNSEPLDIGRKSRVIPAAMRRAVIARDRHCQHPGCFRAARWCDVDHKIDWIHGGETKLSNLQLLCRHHHRLKHQATRDGPGRQTWALVTDAPVRMVCTLNRIAKSGRNSRPTTIVPEE